MGNNCTFCQDRVDGQGMQKGIMRPPVETPRKSESDNLNNSKKLLDGDIEILVNSSLVLNDRD